MSILRDRRSTNFFCFSPQVMAITFAAEMLLMLYALAKYGVKTVENRLIATMLLLLAIFQISEYGVCEVFGFDDLVWARIGFVAITLLPALGLHLVQKVRQDKSLNAAYIGYFLSLVFVVAFVFFDSFKSVGCNGNYAIFQVGDGLGGAYFTYYYSLLLAGSIMAYQGWRSKKYDNHQSKALLFIAVGYASFVVPGTFIHFVYEDVTNGLPSIMCGFALLFAVILTFVIAPHVNAESKSLKKE